MVGPIKSATTSVFFSLMAMTAGAPTIALADPYLSYEEEMEGRDPIAVDLLFSGTNGGRHVLLEPFGEDDWLIQSYDIPFGTVDDAAKENLIPIETALCTPCYKVSDIGSFTYNRQAGEGIITVHPRHKSTRYVFSSRSKKQEGVIPQNNPGIILDLTGAGRYDGRTGNSDGASLAGNLKTRFSMGDYGVIHSGLRYTDGHDDPIRNDTFHRYYMQSIMSRIDSGDITSTQDALLPSYGLLGIRFARDFSTNPAFLTRPDLSVSTLAQTPSTVDLFINDRLSKRQVTDPGPVEINHFTPARDGNIDIVVTDIAGNQQIIRTSFYTAPGLLKEGLQDFDISAGILRNRSTQDYHDKRYMISGRYGIGMADYQTLYGYGQLFNDDNDKRGPYSLIGGEYITGTPIGNFSFSASAFYQDAGAEHDYGLSTISTWNEYWTPFIHNKNSGWFRPLALGLGAAFIYEENFQKAGERIERDRLGNRVFTNISLNDLSLGASYFDIDEQDGYSFQTAYDFKYANLNLSVKRDDDHIKTWAMTLNVPLWRDFPRHYKGRVRHKQAPSGAYETDFSHNIRGRLSETDIYSGSLSLSAEHDRNCCDDGSLSVAYNHSMPHHVLSAGITGFTGNPGDIPLFANVTAQSSMIFDFDHGFHFTKPFGDNAGWVIIEANQEGIPFKQGGETRYTNDNGESFLTIPSFGERFITVNPKDLDDGYSTEPNPQPIAVKPGQGGHIALDVREPGFFLMPRLNGKGLVGRSISVNGRLCMVYSFGCYIDNWHHDDANLILVGDKRLMVRADMTGRNMVDAYLDVETGGFSFKSYQ